MKLSGLVLALALSAAPGCAMAQVCSSSGLSISCDQFYSNAAPSGGGQDVATDIANLAAGLFPQIASLAYAEGPTHASLLSTGSASYTSNDIAVNVLDGSFPMLTASIGLYSNLGNYYATLNEVDASVQDPTFTYYSQVSLTKSLTLLPGVSWPTDIVVGTYGTASGQPVATVPGPVAATGLPYLIALAGALLYAARRRRPASEPQPQRS